MALAEKTTQTKTNKERILFIGRNIKIKELEQDTSKRYQDPFAGSRCRKS